MVERAAGVGSQNESLDNSAKLIHVLFETHPQGVFLCDSEGRLSDANPTFCAMTGIERPDLLGMGLAGIFSCFQLGQNSSLAPFAGNLDCALRMKDGVSHPVVIQFNEWAPGSWLGFVERQIPLIDNPLSQQNAVACVQNAPIAIYGINRDARIIEVNDFAQKMLGYTRAELLGMSIFQIDPIFNSKRWKENRGDLDFGAIRVFKTFHQRKDGSVFPVQITINRFISEGQEFSFAFAEDISLRTQAEVDLHGSQEMLRKVLDAFPGAVFWKDAHSVYLGCNQACARVAGLNDPEEIIGKHDRDLAWTDRQKIIFDSEDREVIETGMPILGKVESIRRPDGRLMWLSTDLFPLRDEQGKPIGLLGTTHDITERLQAENALKDAETFLLKSQSVSRTGSFSLDLRNLRWIGSPVMDELFGITADYPHDLEHWLKLIHPDQEAAMREYIEAETLSANPHYDTEFRLVRPGSGE
jgi:PAS domain S-box-containing protein